MMLLTVAPHALLELTALFLPLAAWLVAARAGAWNQLMAATFATTAIALPALALAIALPEGREHLRRRPVPAHRYA